MQKTKLSFAILISVLVIVFLIQSITQVPLVKADSNEPITFSSGLTLYSPLNITYSSNVLECNGTFDCPKGVQSSLNYSVDGKNTDGLPWKLDPNSISDPDIYIINGSFELPKLSDGSHKLSIGILEELLDKSNINSPKLINSTSWINTVYFEIDTTTVPEFPSTILTIAFLIMMTVALAVVVKRRKKI
jgi:hypothetical protein